MKRIEPRKPFAQEAQTAAAAELHVPVMFENQKARHDEEHVEKRQHVFEPDSQDVGVHCVMAEMVSHYEHGGEETPRAENPVVRFHSRLPPHLVGWEATSNGTNCAF